MPEPCQPRVPADKRKRGGSGRRVRDRRGKSKKQVHQDMERDRFFKAAEAAEYGLIDRVIEQRELEMRRTGFAAQNGSG